MSARVSLELRWLVVLGIATTWGCDRSQAEPTRTPSETSAPATDGPAEVHNTFVGSDAEPDADDVTDSPPDDAGSQDAAAADDALTVEAANALVTAAIDAATDPYAERVVTPALPPSWPLSGSELVYYVYSLRPQEQGVAKYHASVPSISVRLDVVSRKTTVDTTSKAAKPKDLGTFEHPRVRRDDAELGAEQALIDLAAGRVVADKVRYLLHGYGKWFDRHGKVGADAEKRSAGFAAWARAWGQK